MDDLRGTATERLSQLSGGFADEADSEWLARQLTDALQAWQNDEDKLHVLREQHVDY